MLEKLPRFTASDPLNAVMANYGYQRIAADVPAQKILTNPGLLKNFYDNAFTNKTPLPQNFRSVYGTQEIYLAYDPGLKGAWFISDPQNRIALLNYFRDAVSLGLKADGVLLLGSTPKLTPVGWQNLHDLLDEDFLKQYRPIERVEIMSILPGVRWRPPTLGLGVTFLNMKELREIRATVAEAIRGGTEGEIHR
ncbi:MAG: hypothetical protein N2248_07785 [candidate division WOR-3 bacterium]|uniref:Uncharacterized protein n=1 Tax=candidate division WOR-3 bacterium TaxID=2052148 RepID=A0A7C1NEU3_UNCW3|nr:hypothetical protein [candidate division WOR-3 bacterium]